MQKFDRKFIGINFSLLIFMTAMHSILIAGNTGKIAGTVRDKESGEPLIGVNIQVKGMSLGASTDEKGRYFILQAPAGTYDLFVSYVGYRSTTIKRIKVEVDLTTTVNIQLEQSYYQTGELEIVAEQKMVQKDVTSTRRNVSRENMQITPGIESANDMFKLQGGTYLSGAPQVIQINPSQQLQVRDESIKDIHIRGGRGGEILYMVDGMPMTHPIYGGRSVVDLNIVDVDNVELLTGAFNAEYGQAQSGVVNITTRSGGDAFKSGFEYKTDRFKLLGESYQTDYGTFYVGGPEPITQKFLPEIGINVPGKLNFFLSGNSTLTNTPYNNNRSREDLYFFGLKIKERQDNTRNMNAKVNWALGSYRVSLSYHGSWLQWSGFDWAWKNFPDNTASYLRNNNNFNVQFNHVLSEATYYNLSFGYLGVTYQGSWYGKRPIDFWKADSLGRIISIISPPQIDPYTNFIDGSGADNIWRDDNTSTYTFKGDFTSQVHSAHLMKTGIEVKYNDISYIDIQDGGIKLSNYGEYKYHGDKYYDPPPGPYPEFGQNRWVFNVKPIIGGAYVQDKFELEYLVLNAGLRFDWFYLGKTVMQENWKQKWEEATGLKADWKSSIYKLSPRFGVSFPISENTVVFFSYGHFNQLPELQFYYRDPYSGGLTGNPKLDFEQTIVYEFGFTHQLTDKWVVDIKSYAKDITKQVGSTGLKAALGIPVSLYDNNGYSRARGLEFEVTKGYSDFISGKMTYTIQWASGYSSSAFDDYIRSLTDFPNPIRERRLGWDVRHQIVFQGTISSPENQNVNLFGLKLPDNWNITILSSFSTGLPYTPGPATIDRAESQKQENTATGPISTSTDLKFEKTFDALGMKIALFFDVFNLFDQKNVNMYYGFNVWTGKPFTYGDVQKPLQNFYDWYYMLSVMDPRQFSTGRTTKIGIRVDF